MANLELGLRSDSKSHMLPLDRAALEAIGLPPWGFREGFLSEIWESGEAGARESKSIPMRLAPQVPCSVPRSLADLVIHLGEGILAAKLLAQLVVQGAIEHLPEFLAVHIAISI